MYLRSFLLAAATLLLSALPLRAEDKFLLRQHWEPGKVYHFESNMQMDMTAPGLPGGGGQNSTIIMQMDVIVRKEPGTDRKLADMTFTSIKAMMTAGGEMKTFDSADPAMSEPEFQQVFGALAGKASTIVYDKDDKFVQELVPEGFIPTPIGEMKGPDGRQFAAMIRDYVDFGLTDEALAVGGTFTTDKKIEMMPLGSLTTKGKGRLDSLVDLEGRKHAKIVTEGTMEMSGLAAEAQAAGAGLSASGAKLSSETLFDLERKTVARSTFKNETSMNAGGTQMTIKQTTVTTLKSIADAPAPADKK